MRFALPVTEHSELAPLLDAGAEEFYCGCMDREWSERWGNHDSISRRQGAANVSSRGELREIALEAQRLGASVWLALNGCYSPPQYAYLMELTQAWAAWGGFGVILRDLNFLRLLKSLSLPLRFSLSLLAVAANSAAVRFFRVQGVDRIILPRFLSPSDMESITAAAPALEYEAMVMDDGCPLVDGYCRSIHGCGYLPRADGAAARRSILTWDVSGSAHHLCQELGHAAGPPPCAACALPRLERAGVRVGKFGGRGMPLAQRLEKLRFLRTAQALGSDEERAALYERFFGPCNCYYGSAASPPGESIWS
jgi:hypothetical protein